MKKRIAALMAAGTMLLTGCSALLERDYVSVAPHNAAPTTEGDPSTLRADNYQELVNALVYFVTLGMESGTVRLYTEWENVEQQLEAACLEVVQEDPLGAYSVEFIKYQISNMVPCTEATVQISYRRTREQVASIVSVTGATAIRSELKSALADFASEKVLRIGYFDRDEDFLYTLARQAFYDSPMSALDIPDLEVTVYPDKGRQRIVELNMTYHLEPDVLRDRRDELGIAIAAMSRSVPFSGTNTYLLSAIETLLGRVRYDPAGGTTAWHAVTQGMADREGLALAFSALCQQLRLPCRVVEGTRNDQPHFWNIVSTAEGWRHVDLTTADHPLLLDTQAAELGYAWIAASVPKCLPPPVHP